MKSIRRNQLLGEPSVSSPLSCRELYFFQEKSSGVSRFQVSAGPNGRFPLEEAAGLLAMHCIVLGQSPQDYVVMMRATQESLEGLTGKVEELLRAGRSLNSSIQLTRRQEDILRGVMRSLANKEIAVLLSLSESTVKFHLSALFAKFGVRGRSELALEVTRRTLGPRAEPQPLTTRGERTCADAPPSHGALRVRSIAATSVIGSFRPNA